MGFFKKYFSSTKARTSKLFGRGESKQFKFSSFFRQEENSLRSKECCDNSGCLDNCTINAIEPVGCLENPPDYIFRIVGNNQPTCYQYVKITQNVTTDGNFFESGNTLEVVKEFGTITGRIVSSITGEPVETRGLINSVSAFQMCDGIMPIVLGNRVFIIIPLNETQTYLLPPGKYMIFLDVEGYYPELVEVEITAGATTFATIPITPLPAGTVAMTFFRFNLFVGEDMNSIIPTMMPLGITHTISIPNITTGVPELFTFGPDSMFSTKVLPIGTQLNKPSDMSVADSCWLYNAFDWNSITLTGNKTELMAFFPTGLIGADINLAKSCKQVTCAPGFTNLLSNEDGVESGVGEFTYVFDCKGDVSTPTRINLNLTWDSLPIASFSSITLDFYVRTGDNTRLYIGSAVFDLFAAAGTQTKVLQLPNAIAQAIRDIDYPVPNQIWIHAVYPSGQPMVLMDVSQWITANQPLPC